MKKVLKIILIAIVALFIILGIIWLIGRNKATQNGQTPLTFREFLGLSTKKNPVQVVPSTGSSDFTDTTGTGDGTGNGSGNGGTGTRFNPGNGAFNVNSSTFTSGTYNPSGTGSSNGNGTSGSNGSITGTGTGGTNGTGADSTYPGDSSDGSQPVCSDEDTNIVFTQDELDQLNILQNRFYTLAQTLHNDADVETELANHDAFENKANSIFELYAYCESQLPAVANTPGADSRLSLHIATPFWRSWHDDVATDIDPNVLARIKRIMPSSKITSDPARDSLSFLTFSGAGLAHTTGVHDNNNDNPETALYPNAANGISQVLPGVQVVRGPYGLVTFSNPGLVPTTGSAVGVDGGLGDLDIIAPVAEKFLRLNLW